MDRGEPKAWSCGVSEAVRDGAGESDGDDMGWAVDAEDEAEAGMVESE